MIRNPLWSTPQIAIHKLGAYKPGSAWNTDKRNRWFGILLPTHSHIPFIQCQLHARPCFKYGSSMGNQSNQVPPSQSVPVMNWNSMRDSEELGACPGSTPRNSFHKCLTQGFPKPGSQAFLIRLPWQGLRQGTSDKAALRSREHTQTEGRKREEPGSCTKQRLSWEDSAPRFRAWRKPIPEHVTWYPEPSSSHLLSQRSY